MRTEGKQFTRNDFEGKPLPKGEYDNCTFTGCDFANGDLGGITFTECRFESCNLSMARVNRMTAFRDVAFGNCKLLGLRFDECSDFLFSVSFSSCVLNLASFYKLKLKKNAFRNCSLHEADFTEADLSAAVFDNCDLLNATFERTILEKTDFRTAFNYTLDPEQNRVKKAKFSREGLGGLLAKYDLDIS